MKPFQAEIDEALNIADRSSVAEHELLRPRDLALKNLAAAYRAKVEEVEALRTEAKTVARSLTPFRGSITADVIPGIRSRCRISEGWYTNRHFYEMLWRLAFPEVKTESKGAN